jgi:hypothetical protein
MFWVDIPPVNSNIGISDIKKKKKKSYIMIISCTKYVLTTYVVHTPECELYQFISL